MIKKILLLTLPFLAIGYFVSTGNYTNSINTSNHNDYTTSIDTFEKAHKAEYTRKKVKHGSIKNLDKYRKQMQKSTFSKQFAQAVQDSAATKVAAVKPPAAVAADEKKKKDAAAKKKKATEEQAKKDEEEEKKKEKTEVAKYEDKSNDSSLDSTNESNNDTFSDSDTLISSTSFSSFSTQPQAEETTDEETEDSQEPRQANTPTTPRGDIETFNAFSAKHFKDMLEENRLVDFEQALQLDLTTEQRAAAYKEALNFLFQIEKDTETFFSYDNFIRSQFLRNHEFATSIASALANPDLPSEQVSYSAGILNQLVLSWSSEHGNAEQFNEIYETSVLGSIHPSILEHEAIIALQSSIETVSFDILNPTSTVEVSAI